ncbi:hypothetical protein [Brachybacterium hainanense]|uniref:Uncharacterized protein n=1 Tax=Brachybacterium hainanense TaxID=1541174 RepID=A0ABV6R9U5_9MICO
MARELVAMWTDLPVENIEVHLQVAPAGFSVGAGAPSAADRRRPTGSVTVAFRSWSGGFQLTVDGEQDTSTQVADLTDASQQVRAYLDSVDPEVDHSGRDVRLRESRARWQGVHALSGLPDRLSSRPPSPLRAIATT